MKRYITLPNGNRVSLPVYVRAWRQLRDMSPCELVNGFDHFPTPAGEVLRDLRAGIADRINRHLPAYGQGRKWSDDWQTATVRVANDVNTPRLAIHYLPPEWRGRFSHRLMSEF